MTIRRIEVTVKQLPETLSVKQGLMFLRELGPCLIVSRPCLVLDCSNLHDLDSPTIHLLLRCLEEAMKRNGDVRLAGVSPEARATLESRGVDRLFRIFELNADAEGSFHRPSDDAAPLWNLRRGLEEAVDEPHKTN
jgi:anti-anti-sigma regulatory factor